MTSRYLHMFVIFVAGLAVYSGVFSAPFVFDDKFMYIVENPAIRDLGNFLNLADTRYLVMLSFAVNYALAGLDVTGYHAVNVAMHIINAWLVYLLFSLMLSTPALKGLRLPTSAAALGAALIFVTHPVSTQAVTYTSQRFTLGAALFFLLALTLYIASRLPATSGRAEREGSGSATVLYIVSIVAAILSQKTKEIAFTLPFIIMLFEFTLFTGGHESLGKRVRRLLPFVVVLAIIPLSLLGPRLGLFSAESVVLSQMDDLGSLSRSDYLFTQFRVVVTYLRLFVLPVSQSLLYDYPMLRSFALPAVFVSFFFLLALFAGSIWLLFRSLRRDWPAGILVSLGVLWFFVTVSVESSVVPLKNVIFEHRLYLPSVGLVFVFITVLYTLVANKLGPRGQGQRSALIVVVIVVIVFGVAAYKRNSAWSSELSLWSDTVEKAPGQSAAYLGLGSAYEATGDDERALALYDEGLKKSPSDDTASMILNNIGVIYERTGRTEAALRALIESIRVAPDNEKAHNNLANLYSSMGRVEDAASHYTEALRLAPESSMVHYNIATLFERTGEVEKAIPHYKMAIEFDRTNYMAHNNLAGIFLARGDSARALKAYTEGLKLRPTSAELHLNIALLYKSEGRTDESASHLEEARRIDKSGATGASARRELASIYLGAKRVADAALLYEELALIDTSDADAHYNVAWLYQSLGKSVQAEAHYKEVIRLEPQSGDAYRNLALIYIDQGDFDDALALLEEAALRLPGDEAIRAAIGEARRRAGEGK